MPEYRRWDEVPDNLKTKTQLGQMGLRPAKDQKPAAYKRFQASYALYQMSAGKTKIRP